MRVFYGSCGQATGQAQSLLQIFADTLVEMASIAVFQLPFLDVLTHRPIKAKHFIIDFHCSLDLAGAVSGGKLWNLNYGADVVKDVADSNSDVAKEFVKEFVKEPVQFTKEFVKAQRRIYKLISTNPQINITAISENLGVSTRQVQKYLRKLTELHLIAREGGRKNGSWKILDKDYDEFFERI